MSERKIISTRLMIFVLLLLVVTFGCSPAAPPTPEASPTLVCQATLPELAVRPADAAVQGSPAPGYFFINEDQSIWAGAGAAAGEMSHWRAGEKGVKVGWFRPEGAALEVTGRRIDGDAPPLTAEIPCCYPTHFQASGLYFPAPGCWEVTAQAAGSTLTFVVRVRPAEE